jgi:tellurite resistance protein
MPKESQSRIKPADLFKDVAPDDVPTLQLTTVEALMAISVLAVAADGHLSEHERQTLMTNHTRFFSDNPQEPFQDFLKQVLDLIKAYKSAEVFAAAKKALSPLLKETAFAIATDLVLADGVFTPEEKKFLLQLWDALEIPDPNGQKILDAMVTKNCRYKMITDNHFKP